MLGLIDYLCPPGRYEGLDILPGQIEFARREITARFPNFGFTLANVSNPAYGGPGGTDAASYRFPYADGSFDVVYGASLFTHLTPAAAANYLRETRRVLRHGGRVLFSFLVLDDYRGPGTTIGEWYRFDHPLENGVAVQQANVPERLIAYERRRIEDMAQKAGLRIRRILPGYWSNTHQASVNEQDLVLFEIAE
jgi:SAM-dependent methyltransferase